MFTQCYLFEITRPLEITGDELDKKLKEFSFSPCTAQQKIKSGWASPVKVSSDMLVLQIQDLWIINLRKQEKIIPPTEVKDRLEEKISALEAEHGRKVSRKEKAQLKEDVITLLTPQALSRTTDLLAVILPSKNLMMVNTASASKAEEVASSLRKAIGTMPVVPVQTEVSPSTLMTNWLNKTEDLPENITLGYEVFLKSDDEDGGSMKLTGMDIADEFALNYLNNGMTPMSIELNWKEKIQFSIDDKLAFKKIKLSDTYKEHIHDELGEADAINQFVGSTMMVTDEIERIFSALK